MRNLIQAVVIAVTIIGVAAGASAAPMRYDCDAEAGHFSELAQAQTGPNYTLRADISAKRFAQHRDWRPGAHMAVTSADGKSSVAMQMAAGSARPESLLVSLITMRDGEERKLSVTTVKVGEAVHASISVEDEVVRAEIAGQHAEIPLKIGTGAKIGVSCSTGQFIFEKLDMTAAK